MTETLVVTVAFNSADVLDDFCASLPAASERGFRLVIVENNSGEREATRDIARRHSAQFVALDQNLGYGGGITAGLTQLAISEDFILIANPDLVFHPGAIDALVDAAHRNPQAAAFGPQILNVDGGVYPSARQLPSLRNGIGHALFYRLWPSNPWTALYLQETNTSTERPAGWLSGACILIRRDVFDAIGGFDSTYFMYFEDVDLGARIGRAGWANMYVPSALVTHRGAHSTSTSESAAMMIREHHRSAYTYLSRKYTGWYLAPLRLVVRGGLSFRSWWLTRRL
ncbi:glycosyltransferase family 2 protein [Klugiella xanthotipulae]|uniref:N-acetylglucosaminyl-diphospho-decaprenol L-rhamnosyltransferase n=1 Tax=Klugiella xanthotipulae TaxID=244735 RepID=A0A543HYH5_9MICO|nr:glycosyltransferase family 2 protein [Klugiella xanthotipulae]TQM63404.1 N-acetylglucosaminyl-diphospho-decaprenol L-rhamnosyltransferase [Klugiella xanthotipulae]